VHAVKARAASALLALLSIAASACDASPREVASTPSARVPVDPNEAAGVRFVERLTGGARAEEALPLVVAIHGLGDRPESFAGVLEGMPLRARVVLPRGIDPFHDGFAWFPAGSLGNAEQLAAGTRRAADRIAEMLAELARRRPTAGLPIVTGFSQGGMVSFTLAVLHPEAVRAAFPVGGLLAPPLYPSAWPLGRRTPKIHAFHGAADERVPVDGARATVKRLTEVGLGAELSEYPGVGHTISADMKRDLWKAIEAAAQER
jgi:phospholipase/carboxylesterase